MVTCKFCNREGLIYSIDESTGRSRLWDENLGVLHFCDENPYDKKKKKEENLLKWKSKFDENHRFSIPIYCPRCNIAYKPTSVCGHILSDGFKEGIDTIEFYSDNPKQVAKRELLKKAQELKAQKDPQEKLF